MTGANGYIGGQLVRQARASGWDVCALSRRWDDSPTDVYHLPWVLGEPLPNLPSDWLDRKLTLVHLAHDWQAPDGKGATSLNLNVEGTRRLFASAQSAGVSRLIFVSSLSARPDAPNRYGKVKWQTEQVVPVGATVCARVGLVYGGPRGAMYGLLCKLVALPLLPMISLRQRVQPIGLDEVADGLIRLAGSDVGGVVGLAGAHPITFRQFLTRLSALLSGSSPLILPVPLSFAIWGCRLTQYLPLMPTVDPERVLGLSGTRTRDNSNELASIKLRVRDFGTVVPGLRLGYRGLLIEGRVVISQLLGRSPSVRLLRQYARAVTRCRDPRPLGLPRHILVWPCLLRWREPLARTGRIQDRLRVALRLIDASHEGAEEFQSNSVQVGWRRWVVIGRLLILGLSEGIRFIPRFLWPLRVADA